jgi:hypothetical protein
MDTRTIQRTWTLKPSHLSRRAMLSSNLKGHDVQLELVSGKRILVQAEKGEELARAIEDGKG